MSNLEKQRYAIYDESGRIRVQDTAPKGDERSVPIRVPMCVLMEKILTEYADLLARVEALERDRK